jgi:anti-anti-sigma regulatory factor
MLTMDFGAELAEGKGTSEAMLLPLPPVVDTPAVVMLGLLAGGRRPLLLDASAVREVQGTAAPMLESLLRVTRAAGFPARMIGTSAALRRAFDGHPLAAYFADAAAPDEQLFICPDRDEPGFQPSFR